MRGIELDPEQSSLGDTVARFCGNRFRGDGEVVERRFDPAAWRALAELGVLTLATPESGTGALHVVPAMERLGRAAFPGPLVQTFIGAQLLPDGDRERVTAGQALVAVAGASRLVPWAPLADVFVTLGADGCGYRAAAASPVREVETLGFEPWGELELDVSDCLGPGAPAVALGDIALAAYVAGSALQVVEIAADYARHRRQFGRTLGEFQAVAHPLAECHARAVAALDVTLYAAHVYDAGHPECFALAAAARLSATDAVTRATYTGHQTVGGMGFVEGTLLSVLTRMARQVTLQPPGLEAARSRALHPPAAPARA